MKDFECYHVVCQYSSDACSGCKYEMDCYNYFLNYMKRNIDNLQSDDYLKETIKKLSDSVPNKTKTNIDTKIRFEIESNKLINEFAKIGSC